MNYSLDTVNESLGTAPVSEYNSLASVQSRMDANAQTTIKQAMANGATGRIAGNQADRLFNAANKAFNEELIQNGSQYRILVQPSRDINGEVANYGELGSRRLDATITDVSGKTTYSGYDITVSPKRWNSDIINKQYIGRFKIDEGKVREFNPFGQRP